MSNAASIPNQVLGSLGNQGRQIQQNGAVGLPGQQNGQVQGNQIIDLSEQQVGDEHRNRIIGLLRQQQGRDAGQNQIIGLSEQQGGDGHRNGVISLPGKQQGGHRLQNQSTGLSEQEGEEGHRNRIIALLRQQGKEGKRNCINGLPVQQGREEVQSGIIGLAEQQGRDERFNQFIGLTEHQGAQTQQIPAMISHPGPFISTAERPDRLPSVRYIAPPYPNGPEDDPADVFQQPADGPFIRLPYYNMHPDITLRYTEIMNDKIRQLAIACEKTGKVEQDLILAKNKIVNLEATVQSQDQIIAKKDAEIETKDKEIMRLMREIEKIKGASALSDNPFQAMDMHAQQWFFESEFTCTQETHSIQTGMVQQMEAGGYIEMKTDTQETLPFSIQRFLQE